MKKTKQTVLNIIKTVRDNSKLFIIGNSLSTIFTLMLTYQVLYIVEHNFEYDISTSAGMAMYFVAFFYLSMATNILIFKFIKQKELNQDLKSGKLFKLNIKNENGNDQEVVINKEEILEKLSESK